MSETTTPTAADRHRQRRHEAPEVAAASRRFMRALVKRAAEGDTEALEGLLTLEDELEEAVTQAYAALHAAGYSWTDLGRVAGVSRQAARQRVMGK